MRLLYRDATGAICLTDDLYANIPRYAILSHRWGSDEVTFQDISDGTGRRKSGYRKILFCGKQAQRDGLSHFWVDSCCIDKKNAVELQEAINSMFCWYRDAVKCYVYLEDVSWPTTLHTPPLEKKRKRDDMETSHIAQPTAPPWQEAFSESLWFSRGWTLQELLAPALVQFFSKEGTFLGDKLSLEQLICNVTGIPVGALRDGRLPNFSDDEKYSWMDRRQTTREEDMAYALLGILNVRMRLDYGEGRTAAFNRLRKKTNKLVSDPKIEACLKDLRITDPRLDKKRIEETKGGLLADAYRWVLDNEAFKQWRYSGDGQLLWVKGDPGKGKTMLLCGIINDLSASTNSADPKTGTVLSYFFCQATDSRLNNAVAVLRGLIYMLVDQQPTFISHIRKKYALAGKQLFEDINAWAALTEILRSILKDPSLQSIYLIIDALDECGTTSSQQSADLTRLLRFISQNSNLPRVNWIISSRNLPSIEEGLVKARQKVSLSLELNAKSISEAVAIYICHKVNELAELKGYNNKIRCDVHDYLLSHANDTFLWVALVCQALAETSRLNTLSKLRKFPPELGDLYRRMMAYILESEDATLCKDILAILACLVNLPDDFSDDESLLKIIGLCGSFLTLRQRTIYFVHQSAKDFLLQDTPNNILPSGQQDLHYTIFSRSLQSMSENLRRDIYELHAPGFPIDKVKQPSPDPLAPIRYSCIYWIGHLCDCSHTKVSKDLHDNGLVETFLLENYLYWLEALSLLRSTSSGVLSIIKLEGVLQEHISILANLVRDGRRFIQYYKAVIESYPLQIYASCLIFTPTQSQIQRHFQKQRPRWIITKPVMDDGWSACLTTLEGHSNDWVCLVAWSNDGRLASGSEDKTIKIWDPTTGYCIVTLEGHSGRVCSVAWSNDGRLASGSDDKTIKIWDPTTGHCIATLEGHSGWVGSIAWTNDGRLASGSNDKTVKLWDPTTGYCIATLEGYSNAIDLKSLILPGDIDTISSDYLICLPRAIGPAVSSVLGEKIAIGCFSGRVLLLRFSEDSPIV
ncbi:hypothetical protein GQ53DRAFT_863078 [Thozetella sp. PMI_491]|nr:hypothetical protein GQ53DRAFT_863078 [Thozetella sp. PMI_491]